MRQSIDMNYNMVVPVHYLPVLLNSRDGTHDQWTICKLFSYFMFLFVSDKVSEEITNKPESESIRIRSN